jgi:hypothetical protein
MDFQDQLELRTELLQEVRVLVGVAEHRDDNV